MTTAFYCTELYLDGEKWNTGGSGLVDDALDFQSRDSTGILRCLALMIVKVGRDRDYRAGNCVTQVVLRDLQEGNMRNETQGQLTMSWLIKQLEKKKLKEKEKV